MLCLFNNHLFILLKIQINIRYENPVCINSVRDSEESRSGTLFAPEIVFTRKQIFLRKRPKRLNILCIGKKREEFKNICSNNPYIIIFASIYIIYISFNLVFVRYLNKIIIS